jgi:transcriptional regulator with XRE-family HTH domain
MTKKPRGNKALPPKKGKRGPYKSDVADPNQLGTGGIRLRQHRLSKGWTIEVLAREASLSDGTITGIEAGKLGYGHETLNKLAKALHVSVGALFDEDPRNKAADHVEIGPLWRRAKPDQRRRIADFAKGVVGEADGDGRK